MVEYDSLVNHVTHVERRRRAADPGQGPGRRRLRQLRHHPRRHQDPADAGPLRDPLQRGRRHPQRPGAAAHGRGRVLVQPVRLRPDVLAAGRQRRAAASTSTINEIDVCAGADPGAEVDRPDDRPVRARHRRAARPTGCTPGTVAGCDGDRLADRLLRREGLRDLPARTPRCTPRQLWNAVLEAGKKHKLAVIAPAHHRRIAAGILSWGQDMDAETLPFQVNLGYQVPRTKEADYIGKAALEAARARARGRAPAVHPHAGRAAARRASRSTTTRPTSG